MKIALCINNNHKLINFNEGTTIQIYSKDEENWHLENTISYAVDNISNMMDIRGEIKRIVNVIEDCKTVVAQKISGICFTILETSGFEIWEMDATVEEALDFFSSNQDEIKDDQIEKIEYIKDMGLGAYEINLIEALSKDKNATSKSLLLPFLRDGGFFKLDVICSHTPPWFGVLFDEMSLEYKEYMSKDGTSIVEVCKKVCSDEQT